MVIILWSLHPKKNQKEGKSDLDKDILSSTDLQVPKEFRFLTIRNQVD